MDVEGFTGANAGRAVIVASGVAALSEAAAESATGRSQVDAVEEIEEFGAELRVKSFGDGNVFKDGEINIAKSSSDQGIARYGGKRTGCGVGESGWIDPLNGVVINEGMRNALERIADLDGTSGVFAGAIGIG